jgi:hypothetical protein
LDVIIDPNIQNAVKQSPIHFGIEQRKTQLVQSLFGNSSSNGIWYCSHFKPHHSNSGIPAEMIFGGELSFAT